MAWTEEEKKTISYIEEKESGGWFVDGWFDSWFLSSGILYTEETKGTISWDEETK